MREDLTNEELILLYDVVSNSINSQFELWLTITFAVIIASYLAGHKLARFLQYLIAVLYTAVSILLYLMLVGAIQFSQEFGVARGASSESNLVLSIVVLRTLVWIFGTIATVVFIFRGQRGDDA